MAIQAKKAAAKEPTKRRGTSTDDFYENVQRLNLYPLWRMQMFPPHKRAVPYLWKWPVVREQILRAADQVGTEDVERRVLGLSNPGLQGGRHFAATPNLVAAIQLIVPGETAVAHHHTPAALRIILEGKGAYTCTNGERLWMEPGDLILTPAWTYHDHENKGKGPMIWLDGLDASLIDAMDTFFFSRYPQQRQQPVTQPDEASTHRFAVPGMRPAEYRWDKPYSPLTKYPWRKTLEALDALLESEASAFDDLLLEFYNPHTGGPVLPSMGCCAQKLRPGIHTRRHRHSSAAVYHAFRGSGITLVEGKPLEWSAGDIFALPGWHWHEHINASKKDPAVLLSYTDRPLLKALGIHMEEQQD
ncbi:MAG TPA: cupin domain-containing protein [Candidatus Binatia bacterium]